MTDSSAIRAGFIGLGNIGQPIAAQLASKGVALKVYDAAAPAERAPAQATVAKTAAEAAHEVDMVFLCLPSFEICRSVIGEIIAAPGAAPVVVDTSTIGPSGARALAEQLARAGKSYIDAPVSGGVHRAREGKLTSMVAGEAAAIARARPAIEAYSSNVIVVGSAAGQAQAMKLVNNYASIAALLSASEAISYGLSQGLDMAAMLAVMNVSSGMSFATQTHFPKHIVNGAFDSAAPTRIVDKDLSLFAAEAEKAGTARSLAEEARAIFAGFAPGHADDDWLRVFEFIRDHRDTERRN